MTVVLAVRCRDGIVMGSDSQITEKDRGMSYPGRKLHPLGTHGAWGGSGARSVLHDLEAMLETEADEVVGSRDVGHALQERMVPLLRRHYELFIPEIPGEELGGTPSAYLLAAGYSHDQPFIVKVSPNGLVSRYEEAGFHAIGSGASMAQQAAALLGHFQMADRDVTYGAIAMVRVIDALRVSQPMVGGPINLARLTAEGARFSDDDEIEEFRARVTEWEDAERQALDRILDG